MDSYDIVKLNKKLAEWAFPSAIEVQVQEGRIVIETDEGTGHIGLLTQSLDACFELLVPKIVKMGGWISCGIDENEAFALVDAENDDFYELFNGKHFDEEAVTPSLALCLAIEKLIDECIQKGNEVER